MAEAASAGAPSAGGNTGGVAGGGVASVTPTATGSVGVSPSQPSAVPQDWTSGFSDEMKGYVQNKGFKGPGDLADSYRNLEKLQGVPQERMLKLPESMESPEARAVWERLGTPKDEKGYNLELPADSKDPKAQEWAAKAFHELGVPKGMAEGMIKKFNERIVNQQKEAQLAQQQAAITAEANLKTEWGVAFEQNKNRIDHAAIALGLTPENLNALRMALGPEGAPKLILKLAAATQESAFVTGTTGGGGMQTPEQARNGITEMRRDTAFMQRVAKGDMEANNKWKRAHEMAYPGTMNI